MRAILIVGLSGAVWSLAPRLAADEGPSEGRKLDLFFRAYLDRTFRAQPLAATRLGHHQYDDQLDDLSAEARAANLERDRKALADLPRQVAYQKLSRDAQIDYENLPPPPHPRSLAGRAFSPVRG